MVYDKNSLLLNSVGNFSEEAIFTVSPALFHAELHERKA